MGPEDRERWIEMKRMSRDSLLSPHPLVAPAWLTTNIISKHYSQKILILVLQMEKSKQNM
jgi:hypothetical protein